MSLIILIALLASIITIITGFFFIFRPKKENNLKIVKGTNKTEEDFRHILMDGHRKIKNIFNNSEKIKNPELRQKIHDICISARNIFDNIQNHPDDITKAKQFINYYIGTTDKIINKYVELYKQRNVLNNAEEILKKTEESFDLIKNTFDKQYLRLFENDITDLDVELEVLKKAIKMGDL